MRVAWGSHGVEGMPLAVEIKCWRFDFNRRATLRVVRCQVVEPDTGTTTDAWKLIEEDELAAG